MDKQLRKTKASSLQRSPDGPQANIQIKKKDPNYSFKNEKGCISTDPTDIRRIIK